MPRDIRGKWGPPPSAKRSTTDIWRNVSLTTEDARTILNAARWPLGKPPGFPDAVEVREDGVSIYELVGAMEIAHKRRRGTLTKARKEKIRAELRNMLGAKRFSDTEFNDLFERLSL